MGKMMETVEGMASGEEFLYLLMYAPGNTGEFNEAISGNTWLQKQMFLLKTTIPEIEFEFESGLYGTYSKDLNDLQAKNIKSGSITQPADGSGKFYLSEKDAKTGKWLWDCLDKSKCIQISGVKKFMNDMSLDELIAYSYSTFPDTASNSEIREQFEKNRIDAACSLFIKEKATIEKASLIAGLQFDDFIAVLKERGIQAFVASLDDFRQSTKELENLT